MADRAGPGTSRRSVVLAWARLLAVVVAVGAGLAGLWWLTRDGDEAATGGGTGPLGPLEEGTPNVGEPAPDFALLGPDGGTVRLSDLRGRPVLVNFWATWCGPCREEMPAIQRLYDDRGGDVAVVAVNFQEPAGAAAAFARDLGLTFPVALDSDGEVASRYGVRGLPSSFFIDARGVVRAVHLGPLDEQILREKLAAAEEAAAGAVPEPAASGRRS